MNEENPSFLNHSKNQVLFTPGPLSLSPIVKNEMRFDLGSRTEDFQVIIESIKNKIFKLTDTFNSHEIAILPGSGTAMIEAVLSTYVSSESKVLVCENGIYGRRASEILKLLRIPHFSIKEKPGEIISTKTVQQILENDRSITHLYFVHVETTYGILNPFGDLISVAKNHDVISIVDSMSAFGGIEISAKKNPFDIIIFSGNKCIEAPPGVSFSLIPKHINEATNNREARTYTLDLRRQIKCLNESGQFPFTPPTHVLQAVNKALSLLVEEGIERRFERYSVIANRIITSLEDFGVYPFVDKEHRFPVCVTFKSLEIQSHQDFNRYFLALQKEKIYIYSLMDEESKTFRIGCIGNIRDRDLHLLEKTFKDVFLLKTKQVEIEAYEKA